MTRDEIIEISKNSGYWSGQTIEMNGEGLCILPKRSPISFALNLLRGLLINVDTWTEGVIENKEYKMKFYRNSSWRKLGFPRSERPSSAQLNGFTPSEFKTFLKLNGFKVPRNFWYTSIAIRDNRYYRFRWWNEDGFVFDESCKIHDFDRWANSTEQTLPFHEMFKVTARNS